MFTEAIDKHMKEEVVKMRKNMKKYNRRKLKFDES